MSDSGWYQYDLIASYMHTSVYLVQSSEIQLPRHMQSMAGRMQVQ